MTPVDNGVAQAESTKTIAVVVTPEVDGGEIVFSDFGIVAGKKGNVPLWSHFADRDGSESHQLNLEGIPDFMELSNGQKVGSTWQLTATDLDKLKISSDKTDISEWTEYSGKYAYKPFTVTFELKSKDSDSREVTTSSGSFQIYAWQKSK